MVKTEDYKHIMECRRVGSRKKGQRSIMRRRRGEGGGMLYDSCNIGSCKYISI